MAMGEKFKCLLRIEQCEDYQRLLQENDSLWEFLRSKPDLEAEYDNFKNGNNRASSYNTGHQQQYQSSKPNTPPPFPLRREVVLFINADQGESVIEHIMASNRLDDSIMNDLPYKTSYIWFGTSFDDSLFDKPESKSEIGYEYDFVAVKMKMPSGVTKPNMSDKFELNKFIKTLCSKNTRCENISNRLPIKELERYKPIQVN